MRATPSLWSHYRPNLRLSQHLAQVRAAARFLWQGHSETTRNQRENSLEVLDAIVDCHDLGKGSPGFQQYIRDPDNYRGDPDAKAHTALSAALAILWADSQGWRPLDTLVLAQAVAGHHGQFAPLDKLRERLRPSGDGILDTQWQGLDVKRLETATGLDLGTIDARFRDGGRQLFRRLEVDELLAALPLEQAIGLRLWAQLLFSILLEADKALLALREERAKTYLSWEPSTLVPDLVPQRIAQLPDSPINPLRETIARRIRERMSEGSHVHTLTLPTGVGKTLLAAHWALTVRQRSQREQGVPPPIFVVLPFLSIIDQMDSEYRTLLGLQEDSTTQSNVLMSSHSLSTREYELEGRRLGPAYTAFYLDTWRSEVVITTFDQLLLALFSPKTRHQLRFHRLLDALIILDEVQTLPAHLWDLVDHGLRGLTREGNAHILMMSATQPALLTRARELAGSDEEVADIFRRFRRYRIRCRHREDQDLDAFGQAILRRVDDWIDQGLRVLITLNTRSSARSIWQLLSGDVALTGTPLFLISADLTPRDRLAKIGRIKQGEPCIVVSTQTIEAGVDIDMDLTLRDFAPLDAIIQIAGRCNRNNRLGEHGGKVELYSLVNERGRRYSEMIYDSLLLEITRQGIKDAEDIGEEQVLALSRDYFGTIKERKDTGQVHTRTYAYWQEPEQSVHSLLRGEPREQHCFLCPTETEMEPLRHTLQQALGEPDRWQRREALRRLAPTLQQQTVCVYARPELHPEDYADELGPFWLLHSQWYDRDAGIDLNDDSEEGPCIL
ncbi:MAG: CRISPR-associated helicase Cas3' [Pseudomonadota bacterium]|nr:CRISPR-associated helicase Cas3' [Pseudomonadota bacterium]